MWDSVNYRYAPASRTMLSFPNVVTKDSRRYVVEELEADGSRCSRRRHRCRRCSRLWWAAVVALQSRARTSWNEKYLVVGLVCYFCVHIHYTYGLFSGKQCFGSGSGFNISLDQDPYPVSVPLSDGRCPRLESIKFITFPFPFRTKNSSGGIIRGKVWRYNQSFFCTWPTTPLVTNYCWFSCTQKGRSVVWRPKTIVL